MRSFCTESCSCNYTANSFIDSADCSSRSLQENFIYKVIYLITLSLSNKTLLTSQNIITLDLSHNLISSTDAYMFSLFLNLEYFDLSYNQIKTIADGSLSSLTKLKILKLNNNLLTSISLNTLNGLNNLEQLYINNNLFKTITHL